MGRLSSVDRIVLRASRPRRNPTNPLAFGTKPRGTLAALATRRREC